MAFGAPVRSRSQCDAIRWSAWGWVSRMRSSVRPRSSIRATTRSALSVEVRALAKSKFSTTSIATARFVRGQAATYCTEPVSAS